MRISFWISISMLAAHLAGSTFANCTSAQEQGIVQAAEPVALSPVEAGAVPAAPITELPTESTVPGIGPGPQAELIVERYPSGAVKIEREMIQDAAGNYLLHGAWRFFDEQGRLLLDGRFERDQKVGLWRRFYQGHETKLLAAAPYKDFSPPFISAATFQAGQLHGTWTMTDNQQRKMHQIALSRGERQGAATWYYPSGAAFLRATYEGGIPSGNLTKFAEGGSVLSQENYQSGRKLAAKIEYHDQARNLKKHEITHLFAALALKTPDNWDTGALATYESSGQDERHGPFSIWHSNGQLARQGEYHRDQPVGKVAAWFPNGQQQLEGQYADGRQSGIWTWWHENGQRAASGAFSQGAAVAGWSWWNTAGKITQRSELSLPGAPQRLSEVRTAEAIPVDSGLRR
jgi:antitoxin component YwqK of YwqJK toxin-antitoxin module